MKTTVPTTIDEYISGFPVDVQKKLEQIRAAIRKAAPDAEETILYAMPAYIYHGHLVFFSAYKKHIGFYPVPAGDEAFQHEVAVYKKHRSTLQFPLDKPLPITLIAKTVKLRMQENKQASRQSK
jgi:uncharacterized protein YdhG (YjbR/CyaY superfamily)